MEKLITTPLQKAVSTKEGLAILHCFEQEDWNIQLMLGKENYRKIESMMNTLLEIIKEDKSELTKLRKSLISKVKKKSNSEKGLLVLNPLCYEWITNEVENRDLSLIKYFK